MDEDGGELVKRSITSEGLSGRAVAACWAASVILMSSGITATFLAGTGAAPAAMIVFGSLFLVLGLMKRVPLSLEVGGAKFDASYIADAAFDAGHEGGIQKGVEEAIHEVEEASERGEQPDVALERLRATLRRTWSEFTPETTRLSDAVPDGLGYRAPVACNAAGITYRQLDYWARTGLVEPSIRYGDRRLYGIRDIVVLKVTKRLLDAGVSLQQIRTAVVRLREISYERLPSITLMSDGNSIFEATTSAEVLDLLESGRGMFGIALRGVVREIEDVLSELPSERGDEPLPFGP